MAGIWETIPFVYPNVAGGNTTIPFLIPSTTPTVIANALVSTFPSPIILASGVTVQPGGPATTLSGYSWSLNATAPIISWQKAAATLSVSVSSSSQVSASSMVVSTDASASETSIHPSSTGPTIPTPRNSTTNAQSSGASPSTVAGAAIGCLIAGAVIAGLVFWFCWGRPKGSRSRNYDASSSALVHDGKGFTANAIPLESRNLAVLSTPDVFPMPLEDKAISGEISKICNSIKNHVQSYYHAIEISPGLLDLDDVKALGSDLLIPAATLGSLLDDKASREIALRFCIAWVVFSKMRPDASPSTSLLPTELAECLRKMVDPGRGSGGRSIMFLS
jgi:hypothetical protein